MKQKVTVELITASSIGDIFTALSMLSPDNLNVKINAVPNSGNGARRIPRKVGNSGRSGRKGRPVHYGDDRIVWDAKNGNIDVNASLTKMNMTRENLMKINTRVGTAEYAVKQGMLRQERAMLVGL